MLLYMSERTHVCYLTLFYHVGSIELQPHTNGPKKLLGDFELIVLLQLILAIPDICLRELLGELVYM